MMHLDDLVSHALRHVDEIVYVYQSSLIFG